MEEGELSDSDSEQLQSALAAPVKTTTEQSLQLDLITTKPTFRRSDVPGLSSGSSDNDSADDSENDCGAAFKKKRCKIPGRLQSGFTNPLLQSNRRGLAMREDVKPHKKYRDLDSMETDGGGSVPRRKRGNVWGNVIEEQTLEREISSIGVKPVDLSVLSYRDVEAYQVPTRPNVPYTFSDHSDSDEKKQVTMDIKEEEKDDVEAKEQEGLFEIETFGTDAKKDLPRLSVKDRLGKVPVDSDEDVRATYCKRRSAKQQTREPADFKKELERYKLKRKRETVKAPKKDVRDRLGRKSQKYEMAKTTLDYISVTETDSKGVIVNALVTNLQEPKVGLMSNVVDVLGAKKAITLMTETATIEASGGLMVANGSRRRTPGGVFLFLLRNDRHIRKDEVNLIFKEEREITLKEKRRVLRAKRSQLVKRTSLKLPQDIYHNAVKPTSESPLPAALNPANEDSRDDVDAMEDGELDDDNDDDGLGSEPELEVQLD